MEASLGKTTGADPRWCRSRPRWSPQIDELPRNKWRGPSEAGEEAVYAGGYLREGPESEV